MSRTTGPRSPPGTAIEIGFVDTPGARVPWYAMNGVEAAGRSRRPPARRAITRTTHPIARRRLSFTVLLVSRSGTSRGSSARVYCRTIMANPVTVEKFAVGQSVRRIEDPRLLQGFGRYADDVNLPHQAYAVVVRSPHAHAAIRSVDTTAARAASGVLGVFTGEDLAADGLGDLPTDKSRKRPDGPPAFATPRPALVRGRARHVGDPVALVVAQTIEPAVDAGERAAIDF